MHCRHCEVMQRGTGGSSIALGNPSSLTVRTGDVSMRVLYVCSLVQVDARWLLPRPGSRVGGRFCGWIRSDESLS